MDEWRPFLPVMAGIVVVHAAAAILLVRLARLLLRPRGDSRPGRGGATWWGATILVVLLAHVVSYELVWPRYVTWRLDTLCPELARVDLRVSEPAEVAGLRIEPDTPGIVELVLALTTSAPAWPFVEVGPDAGGLVVRADARWARPPETTQGAPRAIGAVASEAIVELVREVESVATAKPLVPSIERWTRYRLQVIGSGEVLGTYAEPMLRFLWERHTCSSAAVSAPVDTTRRLLDLLRRAARPA